MVRTLHSAGIEVILDVVYNHTGEGDHTGPTLAFRGIDNLIYYRLDPSNPRRYLNVTGTGSSLNTAHRVVLALVMDSLRYWVEEMHVDGFRFDLATTLARNASHAYDRNGAFLSAVRQDPVISQVKLIAEPWDVAEGGYQLGNFPPGWAEWNDKYRDAVRSYWKGEGGVIGELASRLSGSSDIFQPAGRGPTASINFVTAHDGFTLEDLVSYNDKRNEANLEANRDGSDNNRSSNYGFRRSPPKKAGGGGSKKETEAEPAGTPCEKSSVASRFRFCFFLRSHHLQLLGGTFETAIPASVVVAAVTGWFRGWPAFFFFS